MIITVPILSILLSEYSLGLLLKIERTKIKANVSVSLTGGSVQQCLALSLSNKKVTEKSSMKAKQTNGHDV